MSTLIDPLAERQVLAACMADAEALREVRATGIASLDFAGVSGTLVHEAIYKAILRLHGQQSPVTPLTVAVSMTPEGHPRRPVYSVLSRMDTELETVVGIGWWAERVMETARRRRLAAAAHQIAEGAERGLDAERAHAILGDPTPERRTIVRPIPTIGVARDGDSTTPPDHTDADDRGRGGGEPDDLSWLWA